MPAVGIADRANLFGALEFSEVLSDNGIQPIVGCQLPMSLKEAGLKKLGATDRISMLFLATNELGYRNLMELSTKFFLNDTYRFEGMSVREIDKFSDGLICLSGGDESPINNLLKDNKIKGYTDIDFIQKEVNDSKNLFKKNNWPTIDVTRRSVEETAASILKIIEIKKNK